MPLYADGRSSGLLVNVGDQLTLTSAYYDGYRIAESCKKVARGGRDVT